MSVFQQVVTTEETQAKRNKSAGKGRRFAPLLVATMLFQSIIGASPTGAASPADSPIQLLSESAITYGATLRSYEYRFDRNNVPVKVNADVIQIDLQNPMVRLDTMAGTNGQFTKKQTVRQMANETGAVAAVNGDFYNTQAEGVPMGPQVMNGKLLATPPFLPGFYSFALTKDNKPIVDLFTFQGKITAKDGASYELGGINKTYYWYEEDGVHEAGKHTMIDGLFMYTNAWGQSDRSNDGVTVPTEILVRNGVIEQIASSSVLNIIAPVDGYILRASGKADEFVQKHLKVGDRLTANYKVTGQDPTMNYDAANFKMMVGGHTILVDNGQPAAFSRNVSDIGGYRSRTAIGYSQDQRYAFLITADNSGDSKGLSMTELQQFMIKVGVWKGLNLDGGGSTQMVSRPLGELQTVLTNDLEYGGTYERRVVNGVGVYSMAPKGEVREIKVSGATSLFIGEKASYSLKAIDGYFNPLDMTGAPTVWSTSQPIGSFQGNTFTALQPGKTTLTVKSGQVSQSIDIEVLGRDQIASLQPQPSSQVLLPNSIYKLPVTVTTKQGATRTVPPELIQWEIVGFKGKIEGDKLTVQSIDPGTKQGRLFARYDGFTSMISMPLGQMQSLLDFENNLTPVTFQSYPTEVVGGTKRVSIPGLPSGAYALSLSYDFTKGTGTKAAYAMLGANGVAVPGQPQTLSVKVKGDNSFNWVRAEVVDAKGEIKRIDLTQYVNWSDWKTLTADLSPYGIAYPMTLKRLYITNPAQGQDERALTGEIIFDDISFQYAPNVPTNLNKVKLSINNRTLTVNDKPIIIDQAPVIYKDNTMVPVRFVVEAMGGEIGWSDSDRKVTILKDNHYAELWLDNADLIIDGKVVTAEVAPMLMNERTMVPLRLLSEKMGWKVGWDPVTYSVTLE
jgi:hypothetical protein